MSFDAFARENARLCRACMVEKPLSEFGVHRARRDGLRTVCKRCNADAVAKWAKQNREKANERRRRWTAENPDAARRHGEKWRAANQEQVRAAKARWYEENKDRWRSYRAARRARENGASGSFTAGQIDTLYRLQRGKCAVCGVVLTAGFHRDHIEPLSSGGTNDISNIQLCCPSCNVTKSATDPFEYARRRGRLL